MKPWIAILVSAAIAAVIVAPARAQVSADLAKQCRAMMVKAHPTVMYGTSGTAAFQRAYFSECIKRQGNMDDASEPVTTPDRHCAVGF